MPNNHTPKKQYGLVLMKTKQEPVTEILKRASAFDDDSESDEDSLSSTIDWMKKSMKKETVSGGRNKHSVAAVQKLLKEDPTIFQYDELHDDIVKQREEKKEVVNADKVERKPKYIKSLMATAEKRRSENEERKIREIQKEREAEGDEFQDKEVIITPAYQKKLDEQAAADAEKKEDERLEEIGNVRNQSDLGGFYRHIYEKVVLDCDSTESKVISQHQKKKEKKEQKFARQYRKRKASVSSTDDDDDVKEPDMKKKDLTILTKHEPLQSLQQDENRNFESSIKIEPNDDSKELITKIEKKMDESNEETSNSKIDKNEKTNTNLHQDLKVKIEEVGEVKKEQKQSIWEKRTVGDVFIDAVKRYYERKSTRLVLCN